MPSVVLITLDTFRADHLGCAGNPVVRSPHLDRLARRGVQWSEAVTAIPLTTPSHATILSGMSPRAHGLLQNRMRLKPSIETLAELMSAGGIRDRRRGVEPARAGAGARARPGFRRLSRRSAASPRLGPTEPRRPGPRSSGSGTGPTTLSSGCTTSTRTFRTFRPPPLDRLYDADYDGPFERLDDRRTLQDLFAESDSVTDRDVRHVVALYASEVTSLDRAVWGRWLVESRPPRAARTSGSS